MGVVKFLSKFVRITVIVLLSFILLESFGQVAYRAIYHRWLFKIPIEGYLKLLRAHPYLVAEPVPNASYISETGIKFKHNKFGFRGEDINSLAKKKGLKRILVFGGSTTYCAQVSNDQTWSYYLNDDLKRKYEVFNLGVPGYSTVEHVIQTALSISDFFPDICIYYVGWNDIRNIHIANLRSDYSDFHGRSQYTTLLLDVPKIGGNSVVITTISKILENIFFRRPEGSYKIKATAYKFTPKVEKRALDLYKRNIRLIILLAKAQGAKVIMVPQVLNYNMLTKNSAYGWIPYLYDKDVRAVMSVYNDALRQVCADEGVGFIKEVLDEKFGEEDFIDNGHFSSKGNKKFADVLAKYINKDF